MFASQFLSPAFQRVVAAALAVVRKSLMLAGLIFVLGVAGVFHDSGLPGGLQAMFPSGVEAKEPAPTDPALQDVALHADEALNPTLRRALGHVSRRYKVSQDALRPIFMTAQQSGRELGLDPLLIIAVIGVESGFNPFSQSVLGAQGLMQVMPRFHTDKLPEDAGELPFIDPVTNVQVGARILKESIARFGGLETGLQQFGGALNDPDRRYSTKVLAEKARLEQAVALARRA